MLKRAVAGVAVVFGLLTMCVVAEQAQATTCTNPTYGNVWCHPGAPAPVSVRHRSVVPARR